MGIVGVEWVGRIERDGEIVKERKGGGRQDGR